MIVQIENLLLCISKFPRFKMVLLLLSKQEKKGIFVFGWFLRLIYWVFFLGLALEWIVGYLRDNEAKSVNQIAVLYKVSTAT